MIVSVFKDLYKSKDVPFHVPLEKIIKRIQQGTSKELVETIRSGAKENKNKLPCILFSGVFNERNSNSLKEHSGLMVLDFDKYPDNETMFLHLEKLKENKHFVLLFISPSGNGIKGVIKVSNKLTKETHPKIFKEFQKVFDYDYFDIVNSNIDRVCFESYDPNIYVNLEAEIFNPVLKEEGFNVSERVPLVPITDEDKIISKIMDWNWSKDFREGERNSFIFDLAGAFCEYGISQTNAEGYILNNVVIGDFSESEAKTTIKSAYKKRNFDSKYFEDYNKIDAIKSDFKKGKKEVIQKHNIAEDVFEEIKEALEHDDFWYLSDKNKPQIDLLKYKLFLERNGFKKHFPEGSQKPNWFFIQSNKVIETSTEKIKDFVLDYLIQRQEINIWKYCAGYQNLFSENLLAMLETVELMMLKDTKFKSYLAFENGILEITKNEVKLIDYIDVNGYVWESQIINRPWETLADFENEYKIFINNISNKEPLAVECVIGYLLSTYKNKMNNKAIILNDEVISENPEGGTGKGLFVQGLRQIRRVSILDGKSFDDKKSFPYQTVSQETQVLVFDDVKKNFDFESKFSLVTEGMTLERKNKDAIRLKVEDSPKMVISTNYAIRGEGNSHDRRRFELEIAQYYGKNLTPYDEFGKQLFDDWELEEFLKFDNYMVYCLQSYLKNGLVKQNAKNLKMRKFIAETSMELFEWISDAENCPLGIRNDKRIYFNKFTDEYQDFKRYLTQKKFNIWVQKYCNFQGLEYSEGISNGERWFMIGNESFINDEVIF
jgi:transcriptional regulator NrdR family protein